MEQQTFQAGDVVFAEGDHSHDAYRIVEGEVQIGINTARGRRPLARLGPGEIFGEMGMIDDSPRAATAIAMKPSTLEVITEDDFHNSVLTDPQKLQPYLSAVFERLRSTNLMLQVLLEKEKSQAEKSEKSSAPIESVIPAGAAGEPGAADVDSLTVRLVSVSSEKEGPQEFTPIDTPIEKFPFRIGRRYFGREASVFSSNDLFLPDHQPYHISRSHCCIDWDGETVLVRDRGSTLGTFVNGELIGKESGKLMQPLHAGENTLILGDPESPFVFRVEVGSKGISPT